MKTCIKCGEEKSLSEFEKYRRHCKKCNIIQCRTFKSKRNLELINKCCDICDRLIVDKKPQRSRKDKLYRCVSCQFDQHRINLHESYLRYKDKQQKATKLKRQVAIQARILPNCYDCDVEIKYTGIQKRGSDDNFRCTSCQKIRATRLNIACNKRVERRYPEIHKARNVIRSVKQRLKEFDYDFERFTRPTTRDLAKAIVALPKTCQSCGIDNDLTIEHIKPVIDYPELALTPSNFTTLCRSCNSRSYAQYCVSKSREVRV